MSNARNLADLLDSTGDIKSDALDNVPAADVVNDTTPQLGGDLDTNGSNINFSDNVKAQFGASNDLQIYHTGSYSTIHDSGTGNLSIKATDLVLGDSGGNAFVVCTDNGTGGEVALYHNAVEKLTTTSTGVSVTGNIVANGEYAKLGNYNVISGSQYYGDFDININDLSTLSGGNWKSYGFFITYCGVAGDQSNQMAEVCYVRLRGLSTWNQYSVHNIVGTTTISLVSASSSSVTIRVTTPGAYQEGGFTVLSTANSGHYVTTDG